MCVERRGTIAVEAEDPIPGRKSMIDQVSNESRSLAFKFSPRRRTAADVIDGQHGKCVFATAGARLPVVLEDFKSTIASELPHVRTQPIAMFLLTLMGVRQFLFTVCPVVLPSFLAIVLGMLAIMATLGRLHRAGMGLFPFLDRLSHLRAPPGYSRCLGQFELGWHGATLTQVGLLWEQHRPATS